MNSRLKADFLGYLTNKIKSLSTGEGDFVNDFFEDRNITDMEEIELYQYLEDLEVVEEK